MTQDPADFLPPEIAAKIFLESLTVKTTGNLRRNNAIQTLRLVSPRWNDLALHTPQLWTSLTFRIQHDACHEFWLRVSQWVERAGGLPVALFVLGNELEGDDVCNDCVAILREFEDVFKSRVTTLFCAPKDLDLLIPIMGDTESLILLDTDPLDLDDDQVHEDRHALPRLKKIFCTLPHLRRLCVDSLTEDDVYLNLVPDTPSHWAQLTHLILSFSSLDSWAVVVAHCKNLTCGVFSFTSFADPAPSRPTRRQISNLECLRSLTLDFWGIATPTVFDYITCPNLTHLRLTSLKSCRKEDWNPNATSHISNQIRNVSHLSFIFPNFSFALRSILHGCSESLEILDLDHNLLGSNKICARILEELTIAQEVPYVLNFPLLRLLTIHIHSSVSAEYLEGTHIQLKRLISTTPLMNDAEGTLRQRGVSNGVIIHAYSAFIYTTRQLEDLRDLVTGGEDMPLGVVILVLPDKKLESYMWQYRIEEDSVQWYDALHSGIVA